MVGELIGCIALTAHVCAITCVGPLFCGYSPTSVYKTEYELIINKKDD